MSNPQPIILLFGTRCSTLATKVGLAAAALFLGPGRAFSVHDRPVGVHAVRRERPRTQPSPPSVGLAVVLLAHTIAQLVQKRRLPPSTHSPHRRKTPMPITHHEVPTHLDVEDKVLYGLTVRQFLYLLVGSSGELRAVGPGPRSLAMDCASPALACVFATTPPRSALVRPGRSSA